MNSKDDISIKRIINVPRRGIGLRTIEKIEDRASLKQESIYSVLIDIETNSEISTKARNSISEFVDNVIGTLRTMREVYPVSKLIEKVIESIDYYGYIDELYKGDKEEAEESPLHVTAKAMLSSIRTGNAEGLSKALEDHYQMCQDKILNA